MTDASPALTSTIRNDERTSPVGLANYAEQYLRAADATIESEQARIGKMLGFYAPAYYLVLHSIELSLKAYLLSTGVTVAELEKRLKHDVPKCFDEAMEKGLGSIVEVLPGDAYALNVLLGTNVRQALRYQRSGTFECPPWDVVRPLAFRLCRDVSAHVGWRRVVYELPKGTVA